MNGNRDRNPYRLHKIERRANTGDIPDMELSVKEE
jgi:hypothetical protein